MKNFSIIKIWDLRAELDNAVASQEYDKIRPLKQKYRDLIDGEMWFNKAFICYNHGFWNDSQRASHNFANINSIYKNIENFEYKYIENQDVSLKLSTQHSTPFLAGEIWILRAMYDKFLESSKNCENDLYLQQNLLLGKAVCDRLSTLTHMNQLDGYHDDLNIILNETKDGYKNIYGHLLPKTEYSQLSKDYLEE